MFHSSRTQAISAALIFLGMVACKREEPTVHGEKIGRGPGDEAAHSRTTDPSVNDGTAPANDPAYQAGRSRDQDGVLDAAPAQGNASGGTRAGTGGSGSGGRGQSATGGTAGRARP